MIKRIRFRCEDIIPSLSLANKVIATKNPIPILGNVRMESSSNCEILITSSDGETFITQKAKVLDCDNDLLFCIEAKSLLQLATSLANKEVVAEIDDEKHVITFKYDKGHCVLPFDDASNYPIPNANFGEERSEIMARYIYDGIGRALFSVGTDELRQVMNGVHFDFFADGMVSVATDAKKLVKMKNKAITHDGEMMPEVKNFTLPTKPCNLLLFILQKSIGSGEQAIKYAFDDRNVIFNGEEFCVIARLVDGRYPNYDAVIPRSSTKRAVISKDDFISALKHILPISDSTTQLVSLKFDCVISSGVTIESHNIDYGKKAQEFVECEYEGEDITIAFNGSALLQMVQNVDGDKFVIELDTPQRAGVIKEVETSEPYEYTSILMPMNIINI